MVNPELLKEFIAANIKELLKENLKIDIISDTLFGTLNITVSYDDIEITSTSIYSSDVEELLRKERW